MTRWFDAPPTLVFSAHTQLDYLRQWWGPRSATLSVCEADVRIGGAWRFVCREGDGFEHGFHGEYKAVSPPDTLSYTFEYEGMPGHVCLETLTFEEHDGRTLLTDTTAFDSREDRDGMLATGMEEGANESMDRLDELLARLR
jgi:uncharacterized protein YndB with AHSA1/START domain